MYDVIRALAVGPDSIAGWVGEKDGLVSTVGEDESTWGAVVRWRCLASGFAAALEYDRAAGCDPFFDFVRRKGQDFVYGGVE
jgi:hypothetical protein